MNSAHGWAFARPVRKVYRGLVITGLSIGAAFIIGTIEIPGILTTGFHLNGGFWNPMANFNINLAGFCIAGLFTAAGLVVDTGMQAVSGPEDQRCSCERNQPQQS
jgi:high-affinity nickel-transport protein